MAVRPCSECDRYLPERAPTIQKTCTPACRAKRSRRLKKQKVEAGRAAHASTPAQSALLEANRAVESEVRDVVRDELRPIVREAITEDVLRSVKQLVDLTPLMLSAIEQDLRHPEPEIRQKAYTLLAKYTLGNPSVAPKSAEAQPAPMQVVFQMPRPSDVIVGTETLEAVVVETKECVECKTDHPSDAFVAGSDRCQGCHSELQARVAERFSDG